MCNNACAPLNANVRIAPSLERLFQASEVGLLFSGWVPTKERTVHIPQFDKEKNTWDVFLISRIADRWRRLCGI